MKKLMVILSVSLLVVITAAAVYAKGVEPTGVGLGASDSSDYCNADVWLADGSHYTFEGAYKLTTANNAAKNGVFRCQGVVKETPPTTAIHAEGELYPFNGYCWDGHHIVDTTNWGVTLSHRVRPLINASSIPAINRLFVTPSWRLAYSLQLFFNQSTWGRDPTLAGISLLNLKFNR